MSLDTNKKIRKKKQLEINTQPKHIMEPKAQENTLADTREQNEFKIEVNGDMSKEPNAWKKIT